MKLTCTQENLKKAVLNTERVVSKQTTLPILNNILFEVEKGVLKLNATNLEIGVMVKVGAKIDGSGKAAIPIKLLSNFINNLPQGENIELDINENVLKIKSGNSKAVIKGFSADDFPIIPQKSSEYLFNIPYNKLKDVINRVIVCVAPNETRQELGGINLILNEDKLYLAATDSFRLAEGIINLSGDEINKKEFSDFIAKTNNIIIPLNTLVELARIISNDPNQDGAVGVAIEDGQIFFDVNGVSLVSRLINGKYPEYKHILPKNYATEIILDKKNLQSMVKMASVFSGAGSSEISVKIDADASKILIEGKGVETGENISEVKLDVSGPSQEIIFNSRYLLDGINTISTSQIAILVNSGSSPVALRDVEGEKILDDYIYIVMPIKN